jgi:hypothetical protein
MPLGSAPATIQLPRREPFNVRRFLIGGIPLWVGIIALGAIVVTFGIGVFALKKDWADSAWIAAFVALAGAGVILTAGIAMLSLRRFQWLALGLSALLLVSLSASGAYALTKSANHPSDTGTRPGERQTVAGVHPRVWSGWGAGARCARHSACPFGVGRAVLQRSALSRGDKSLLQALADDSSNATVETRAQKDLYQAYTAWLYANPPDEVYAEMAGFLEKYLQLTICNAECRSFTRPLAALAIYKSGVAALKKSPS